MTNLDRAILTHIFNSKTQPTVADAEIPPAGKQFALSSAADNNGASELVRAGAPQHRGDTIANLECSVQKVLTAKLPVLCDFEGCPNPAEFQCDCGAVICSQHSFDTFGQRAKYGLCAACSAEAERHFAQTQAERFGGMTLIQGGK